MRVCELLSTTNDPEAAQEVVAKIILTDENTIEIDPVPGWEQLKKTIPEIPYIAPDGTKIVTIQDDPVQWFEHLPFVFTGAYLNAKIIPGGKVASYLGSLRDRLDKLRVVLASSLDEFYSALGPRLEDVRSEWQQFESESAPRFNACRLLQPDENGLSRVIAELLRPNGRHGQGKVFLDLFLDQIGHKELAAGSRKAIVRTEEFASGALEGGRIDITIRSGEFCVAIENKPWAGDQPSQLQRYAEHLENRCEDFCLVYVSKCGDPPPANSIPEAKRDELERAGRFKILSYAREFKCWLQACRDAARPENVRSLIDSLSSYLDEEGPLTRKEKDEILEHAFEDP